MTDLAIDFETLHPVSGPVRSSGRLLVAGGRIEAIADRDTAVPEGVRVLGARTVTPGLINAHVHLEMDAGPDSAGAVRASTPTQRAVIASIQAQKAVRSGVTTVRDLGSSHGIAVEIGAAADSGLIDGPDVVAAGRAICMQGGHGWFIGRQANGPWDVRTAVREQLSAGARCIKFIATGGVLTPGAVPGREQLTFDELAAGVDEAHRHGLTVAAHAIGTTGIQNAVRAGVDSIEHGHLVDGTGIELMLEHGTALVPTLAALWCIVEAGRASADRGGMPESVLSKAEAVAATAQANLQAAVDAGVRLVAGSDAGTPFNPHDGFAHELDLMRSMLGLDAERALRAATLEAAELLGSPAGRIEPGAPADLLLLDHELDDPGAFVEPQTVIRSGRIVS